MKQWTRDQLAHTKSGALLISCKWLPFKSLLTNSGVFEKVISLEKRLKEALAAEKLSEHFVIQDFRKGLESEIQAIDALLLTRMPKELTDRERVYLLDKKALYERFFEVFGGNRTKSIELEIKNYLSDVQ
jgi:hypothetical protein